MANGISGGAGLNQGTVAPPLPDFQADFAKKSPKEQCEAQGRFWDEATQTCLAFPKKEEQKETEFRSVKTGEVVKDDKKGGGPLVPETFTDPRTGRASGISLPGEGKTATTTKIVTRDGRVLTDPAEIAAYEEETGQIPTSGGQAFLGLNPEDVQTVAGQQQDIAGRPPGTLPVGSTANFLEAQQQAQALQGQVGQFGQLPTTQPGVLGEFDYQEALIAGARASIPAAIGGAAAIFGASAIGAAAGGAATGAAVGSFAPGIGTVIGGAIGLTGGMVGGILANMNSQRRDTTTAQQRVLDEGKQNLQDWVTLARSDPNRRAEAIRGFNQQLVLIDQAYRQMKIDTNADVLKFETALPNLAEFEAFYSLAGERDFLTAEMNLAVQAPVDPTWAMLELAQRRQ